MYLLDTDHWGEYLKGTSPGSLRLRSRLADAAAPVGTSIISVEEVMRGWLAQVRRVSAATDQVPAYSRLQQLLASFAAWTVVPFDVAAAQQFDLLRTAKIRSGTMDLKIAAIALATGATLLTGNTRDFARVPNLEFEDWLLS